MRIGMRKRKRMRIRRRMRVRMRRRCLETNSSAFFLPLSSLLFPLYLFNPFCHFYFLCSLKFSLFCLYRFESRLFSPPPISPSLYPHHLSPLLSSLLSLLALLIHTFFHYFLLSSLPSFLFPSLISSVPLPFTPSPGFPISSSYISLFLPSNSVNRLGDR